MRWWRLVSQLLRFMALWPFASLSTYTNTPPASPHGPVSKLSFSDKAPCYRRFYFLANSRTVLAVGPLL